MFFFFQICCHPGLIKSMLDAESKATEGLEDEQGDDIDLISQLADMSIRYTVGIQ